MAASLAQMQHTLNSVLSSIAPGALPQSTLAQILPSASMQSPTLSLPPVSSPSLVLPPLPPNPTLLYQAQREHHDRRGSGVEHYGASPQERARVLFDTGDLSRDANPCVGGPWTSHSR